MGWYNHFSNPEDASQELSIVEAQKNDIQPEEFPEGAYGSSQYLNQKLGKSTPWKPKQQVVSRNQDENPAFSDRKNPKR